MAMAAPVGQLAFDLHVPVHGAFQPARNPGVIDAHMHRSAFPRCPSRPRFSTTRADSRPLLFLLERGLQATPPKKCLGYGHWHGRCRQAAFDNAHCMHTAYALERQPAHSNIHRRWLWCPCCNLSHQALIVLTTRLVGIRSSI